MAGQSAGVVCAVHVGDRIINQEQLSAAEPERFLIGGEMVRLFTRHPNAL